MYKELYSALDASINRALEGIRVCEDIARFSLREPAYSLQLKSLRHRLGEEAKAFPHDMLLHGRDIEGDEQKFADLRSELRRASLMDLLRANFRRSIEALRTMEELSKLMDVRGVDFQGIRFALYSLEKNIILAVDKSFRVSRLQGGALYAILDSAFADNGNYADVCLQLIKGGAAVVQLRMKDHGSAAYLAAAIDISRICHEHDVIFIVNDRPDIALLSGANGVHLGQDDIPVAEARKILPHNMIIGKSTHSPEEALLAIEEGPDYIALGPIYGTMSKNGSRLRGIGTDIISQVKEKTAIPLVAIGGINPANAAQVIATGCQACAVISYLYAGNTIEENCRTIIHAMKQAR